MSAPVRAAARAPGRPGLVVVKLGGRTQDDAALPGALARAWRATGGRLVVVHGGGDQVSALQRARGVAPAFVGGRRVTTAADVDDLRMALSGAANKRLVAALQRAGVPALGLSGEDGALITAAPSADAQLGEVGEVGRAPAGVNAGLLELLLGAGYCPVVSPVSAGAGEPGRALNVNGDDAAAAVAAALGAAELLLVADVPGVLAGGAGGAVVGTMDAPTARSLVAAGVAAGGMAAKLEAACAALAAGVARVRVGGAAMLDDPSAGTVVTGGGRAAAAAGDAAGGDAMAGPAGVAPAAA